MQNRAHLGYLYVSIYLVAHGTVARSIANLRIQSDLVYSILLTVPINDKQIHMSQCN